MLSNMLKHTVLAILLATSHIDATPFPIDEVSYDHPAWQYNLSSPMLTAREWEQCRNRKIELGKNKFGQPMAEMDRTDPGGIVPTDRCDDAELRKVNKAHIIWHGCRPYGYRKLNNKALWAGCSVNRDIKGYLENMGWAQTYDNIRRIIWDTFVWDVPQELPTSKCLKAENGKDLCVNWWTEGAKGRILEASMEPMFERMMVSTDNYFLTMLIHPALCRLAQQRKRERLHETVVECLWRSIHRSE